MSTSHSSKRKRTENVEPSTESAKRTRSTAKSASKPSEPIVTPKTSRSKQQARIDTGDDSQLVVEERVISLRSKEITTPIQRRRNRQQTAVTGDSSAADSDNDAWEGMDVEESSVSGSEMSTPAKRLYGRKLTSAACVLPTGNRRSLPAVVSARRTLIEDSAGIDDASVSEEGSVASCRSNRRASYAGGASSRVTGRGATSGAGSTALALLAAAGSQADESRSAASSSSSAGAGSRARRGNAESAAVSEATAAPGPTGRDITQRQVPAPSSSSSSAPNRQTVAPPAAVLPADQARQGGGRQGRQPVGQPAQLQAEATEEAEGAEERGSGQRWRAYLGRLLVLLVSAAVAYCLAGAASSVVSVHPVQPAPPPSLSTGTVADHTSHRQATVPPSAVRDVDVEALLQRVDAGIKAHLASIRAAQSVADTLHERAGKVNASLVAAIDRQAAVTVDTELHLRGLLRDLDSLQGNASAFSATVTAHLNDSAALASQLGAADASAVAALAEKVEGELSRNVSSARARSEELVGQFTSELRALAERTGALTSRRAAQTGLSVMEKALPPLPTLSPSHLLEQTQQASAALTARAEVCGAAVEVSLPCLLEGMRTAVNGTADRLAEAQRRVERDGAEYEELQQAAVDEARALARTAAERAQAEADAAVAEAVAEASAAAAASASVTPKPANRDVHLSPEESDRRIELLAEELVRERAGQKRAEATERFETEVAAQTETILQSAEDALQEHLQSESQLEALLHRTGYSHSNLGLESFKDALWEVDQAEEEEEQEQEGEESAEGEGKLQEGEMREDSGLRLERGQLARMHDFAVGVRGGRALPHRVLCLAGGGLRLTSPPASSAADGANSLTNALLSPFRGLWGAPGSSNREQRGARHSAAGARGSQRRMAALPVTTVVSHTRPSPDSYYAMAHSSNGGAKHSRAASQRRARSHRELAFYYASAEKEALAQVTVVMHAPVNVTVLRVVHATAGPDPAPPACAPRSVRVLGWTEDPSKVRHLAGRVMDLGVLELGESVPCHAYPAAEKGQRDSYVWERAALPPALVAGLSLPPLRAVTLQVLESEGESDSEPGFTCLHRVQVVGAMVA